MYQFSGDNLASGRGSTTNTTTLLVTVIKKLSDHNNDASLREEQRRKLDQNFRNVDERLGKIVESKQESLNNTLNEFQTISSSILKAKTAISNVKQNLVSCKDQLKCKREELKRLHVESQEHGQVLEMLDQIERLSKLQDLVNKHIGNNHFLHAAEAVALSEKSGEALSQIPVLYNLGDVRDIKEQLFLRIIEQIEHEVNLESSSGLDSTYSFSTQSGTAGNVYKHLKIQEEKKVNLPANSPQKRKTLETPVENLSEDPSKSPYTFLPLLVESLATLQEIPRGSEILKAHFPVHIQRMINDSKEMALSSKKLGAEISDVFQSWLETILSKLRKSVEMHSIVTQRLNVAAAKTGYSNKEIYSIEDYMNEFQVLLQKQLAYYLTEPPAKSEAGFSGASFYVASGDKPSNTLMASSSDNSSGVKKKFFSFSSQDHVMGSSSLKSSGDSSKLKQNQMMGLTPSIYNLTVFYYPVLNITRYICHQLGISPSECSLRQNLDNYLNHHLISAINHEMGNKLNDMTNHQALNSAESSLKVLKNLKSQKPLHHSAIAAFKFLAHLSTISEKLPVLSENISKVFVDFLSKYATLGETWVSSLYVGADCKPSMSSKILGLTSVKMVILSMQRDTQFEENIADIVLKHLISLNAPELRNIDPSSLMMSENYFQVSATLSHSLNWLCERVKNELLEKVATNFRAQMFTCLKDLEKISISFLIGLNIELKLLCTYHMLPLLVQNQFSKITESFSMNAGTRALCKLFTEKQNQAENCLGSSKAVRVIFNDMGYFMRSLFVLKAPSLGFISTNGVDHIVNNLCEIRTSMKGLHIKENDRNMEILILLFDNLHQPPDQLLTELSEMKHNFTSDECRLVLNLSAERFRKRENLEKLLNQLNSIILESEERDQKKSQSNVISSAAIPNQNHFVSNGNAAIV